MAKKAKTVAKDGEPKAKRAKTGYLLFADKIRPTVKAELEAELEEGAKLKPQATVTEIAKRWKALTDDERADWNAQAKELAAPVSAPVAAVAEPEQGATDEERRARGVRGAAGAGGGGGGAGGGGGGAGRGRRVGVLRVLGRAGIG